MKTVLVTTPTHHTPTHNAHTHTQTYESHIHFADAIALNRALFGPGIGSIYFDDVGCRGAEDNITSCTHRGVGISNCGHTEDASVLCKRELEG